MDASQTELDSHVNMCVFGRNGMIISESNRSVDVNTFAEGAGGIMKVYQLLISWLLTIINERTKYTY